MITGHFFFLEKSQDGKGDIPLSQDRKYSQVGLPFEGLMFKQY